MDPRLRPARRGRLHRLPGRFTDALIEDAILRRRTVQTLDIEIRVTDRPSGKDASIDEQIQGTAADLARWLTRGVASASLRSANVATFPELPPWL